MFGLSALSNAVRTLTDNLTALASTVAEVNAGLRGRLALDGGDGPAALPPAPEARAMLPGPGADPPSAPEAAGADAGPAGNGKARRKARGE